MSGTPIFMRVPDIFCQWRRTLSTIPLVKNTQIDIELDPYPISVTTNFYRVQCILRSDPYNFFISAQGDTIHLYCGSGGNSTAGNIKEFAIGI